jgi:UDP-N-acetylmuramoyl-tripeptide--D-alanyl-D-alanine ligase
VLPYGLEYQGAKILPSSAEHPYLRVQLSSGRVVETNLVGSYNADNVMAALAVGEYFGVSLEEGAKAIEAYAPSNNRSQMTKTEHNTLIIDAYNANPTSMAAALENFSNVDADCKVALLGDMLELGAESVNEHKSVIASALGRRLRKVFFVGKEFRKAADGIAYDPEVASFFDTSDQLAEHLRTSPISGATVLIKGSRGTRMEKVIDTL